MIIAECGINHNGSLTEALKLVDAAKFAGADVAKFQTFKCELFKDWRKDGLKHLELPFSAFETLQKHCDDVGIKFASTPFDIPSLSFLLDNTKMPFLKIASRQNPINNRYHIEIPIILSTGGMNIHDVDQAIYNIPVVPTTLLHCVSCYPAPIEATNLKAMISMSRIFQMPVGLSDHTLSLSIPVAASIMGACIIEKHLTLDRDQEGFDHKASLEPDEFREMVDMIKEVKLAMGDGIKRKMPCEK